jgi:hypothetical protein
MTDKKGRTPAFGITGYGITLRPFPGFKRNILRILKAGVIV